MDALITALVAPGVPLREQESALEALECVISQGAPSEGHVTLVQEVFAKNLVFAREASGTAAGLASTEELTTRTIAVVAALLAGHARHPGGALGRHAVAAPFAALVMRTLLERLEGEKSVQIKVAALGCVAALWTALPADTVVGFLPGTAGAVCKVLSASHDKRTSQRVVAAALSLLQEAILRACDDGANRAALEELDADAGPPAGGPAEALLKQAAQAARPGGAADAAAVRPARKESEALDKVLRDAQWVAVVRGKLGALLDATLGDVCKRSGAGMVHSDQHPHLVRFAGFAAAVLQGCAGVLAPVVPRLLEVQLLAAQADPEGSPLPPATVAAAERFVAAQGGVPFREYVEALARAVRTAPHAALVLSGWVDHVLKAGAVAEFDAAADCFLQHLLRAMVRAVASVGSSDFKAFSRQHGSVLGAVHALCVSLAQYAPLHSTLDPLLADLRAFERWRLHHATLWVLKSVVAAAHRNVHLEGTAELCTALGAVLDAFSATPEQWYFDDSAAAGVAAVTHCVTLCRLMLETFADAASALFAYDAGAARQLRARDRFLMKAVPAVIEKMSSKHPELAETADGVLAAVAGCVHPGDGKQRVARLVHECFDWIVDAVVARTPFVADYPDTPRMLATSLRLLEGLLDEGGADEELLTLLEHVLHHVTDALLVIEGRLRAQQQKESGVLRMVATTASLLSQSVRLKQALLWEHGLYQQGAAVAAVAVAAVVAAHQAQAAATGGDAPDAPPEEEKHPYAHQEVDAWSEERIWCARERRLAQTVLEKIKHYASSASAADHLHVCNALRDAVLIFSCYDGVSDRLQAGRRSDSPSPVIARAAVGPAGASYAMVVDLVEVWRQNEVLSALRLPPTAGVSEVVVADPPRFFGGQTTSILNHLHLIWSPLVARLIPPGFLSISDVAGRLTKDVIRHHSSPAVRVRLKKHALPTVSLGRCVVHVVAAALALMVYVRDFLEDRVRKELWPLLKYHLVLSPHAFYEYTGAKAEYVASTALFRFQHACLLLLLAAFPPRLKEKLAAAHRDPEGHRLAADRPQALEPLFADVIATTERFLDPRQPLVLRATAARLHAHLQGLRPDGATEAGGVPKGVLA
eukprot:TRINITY_DN15685_c0_g1_i2.p1 TRINITY_DN15685_c0_g1~~TRINITY_DN15685_c0_g1_i2.p1  ORF type:complete len:1101 (+),score=407.68 TRINITY_DN15685_c0_g1_i2:146-3448(+)